MKNIKEMLQTQAAIAREYLETSRINVEEAESSLRRQKRIFIGFSVFNSTFVLIGLSGLLSPDLPIKVLSVVNVVTGLISEGIQGVLLHSSRRDVKEIKQSHARIEDLKQKVDEQVGDIHNMWN